MSSEFVLQWKKGRNSSNKLLMIYEINHGNIWTHNWPAPNVSGFIAQLVEHHTGKARSLIQTPLKSWIFLSGFFMQLHELRSLRWSFLHFLEINWCIHCSYWIWQRCISPTNIHVYHSFVLNKLSYDKILMMMIIIMITIIFFNF